VLNNSFYDMPLICVTCCMQMRSTDDHDGQQKPDKEVVHVLSIYTHI